jgi:hypothetical protein
VKFRIVIKHDRKSIRLQIEQLTVTKEIEQYKVSARNKSFILQSNRPLIRSKGLKYFPVKWKVVEGGYHHTGILEKVTKEIEKSI